MVNNTPPQMFHDTLLQQACPTMPKLEDLPPTVLESTATVVGLGVGVGVGPAVKKPLPACNGYHLYQKEIGAVIANMPSISPISTSAVDQRYADLLNLNHIGSEACTRLVNLCLFVVIFVDIS